MRRPLGTINDNLLITISYDTIHVKFKTWMLELSQKVASCVNIVATMEFFTTLVQDDPKLPDDGGEIPKSKGQGWRFDSCL